jgi:hypothetical protein
MGDIMGVKLIIHNSMKDNISVSCYDSEGNNISWWARHGNGDWVFSNGEWNDYKNRWNGGCVWLGPGCVAKWEWSAAYSSGYSWLLKVHDNATNSVTSGYIDVNNDENSINFKGAGDWIATVGANAGSVYVPMMIPHP